MFVKELSDEMARPPGVVGAVTRGGPRVIQKAKTAGLHDLVGKFDRQGLLAAIGEARNGVQGWEAAHERRKPDAERHHDRQRNPAHQRHHRRPDDRPADHCGARCLRDHPHDARPAGRSRGGGARQPAWPYRDILDLGALLGSRTGERQNKGGDTMAVGVEWNGEVFGLVVDEIGDVLSLTSDSSEPMPANMGQTWARYTRRVHKLERDLLIEVDLQALLDSMTCKPPEWESCNDLLPRGG